MITIADRAGYYSAPIQLFGIIVIHLSNVRRKMTPLFRSLPRINFVVRQLSLVA